MTGITMYNVQRVVTPKQVIQSYGFVFCTSYHGDLYLHKGSRKSFKLISSYRADTYISEITT